MALFEGRVRLKDNSIKSYEFHAKDAGEARLYLKRHGTVLTVKRRLSFTMSKGLSPDERQIFYIRMGSMLSSRVGTSTALTLMRDTFKGAISKVSGRLNSIVESGKDLAESLEVIGAPDFPEATVALIRAGTQSGDSGRALLEAAKFERELHDIKKTASKGLYTGIFSFLMAGGLTAASTLWVGPEIMNSPLMKAAGDIDIGWVNTTATVVGVSMTALLIVGIVFWLLAAVGRRIVPVHADKLILKIPFYKDLVLAKNNFIVLYGLAMLVRTGVRTEDALRLSATGAPRGALRNDLMLAFKAVKEGQPWPKAMSTLHPTDKAALLSATDREQVARTLDTLSNQYRELYGRRLGSFVPALNMMSALFLSIAGGLLFGQSIMPMLMASGNLVNGM